MPEPTPDIQDIAQLVEEADALLSEINAVSSTIAQATSDEGPIVEPREWEPPAKPKASGRPASESEEGASAEGAAETVTAGGDGDDAAASEAEGESREEAEAVETPSETDEAAVVVASDGEGSGVEPSAATDVRAEAVGAGVDAGVGADVGAEGDAGGDDADDTSAIDAISAANATSAADDAGDANDANDANDTSDASELGELNAGDAVRIVDPPAEQPVVPETLEDVHEPLCEVELSADVTDEADEVAGDTAGDAEEDAAAGALMDEQAAPVADAEPMPEPLSDAPADVVDEDDEASERVRSLDDELARLADEMIEGEDEDGGVLIDPTGDASSEAASAGDEAEEASGEASDDEVEPAAEAATTGERTKGRQTKGGRTKGSPSKRESGEAGGGASAGAGAAHGSGVGTPPVELKDRVLYHAKAAASSGIEIAREKGPLVAAQLAPAARQTCEKVSKPLEKQSPIVRNAVGVVAVTTALYASAVLFYVAFIRTPPTHQPDKPGTTLIDQTGQSIARHPDD